MLLICFFLSISISFADITNVQDVIRDPVISKRCKALLKERFEKIQVEQRLNALIMRNQKLQNRARPNQKSLKQTLELNHTQLKNTLRLTRLRIESMQENIIRKGCPGLTI